MCAIRAIVLGAAAGGGFPQWNSNSPACRRARAGDPAARPRTQASVAISGDGSAWTLLNASPDLRQQIAVTPELHPDAGLRSSPITNVVLTSGEVDSIAGLLNLRERQPFTLIATKRIHAVLDANPIFNVLARDIVTRRAVELDDDITLADDVTLRLFSVSGKVALYLEGSADDADGDTVGASLSQNGRTLFYIPACAAMTSDLAARLRQADTVMFDGTLWSDDEMIRAGLGPKTGRRMGHMSVSGDHGVIAAFAGLAVRRKILLHINNSNPVLLDDSPERAEVERAGWQVAFDGMQVAF
jgi:pyrroloquinoline quinone biosynthesis protein B